MNPTIADNDKDQITLTLLGRELRGWSYANDTERRQKTRLAHEFVEGWGAATAAIKSWLYARLDSHLGEMKPDYDDSIVGFNEAWDIMRKVLDEPGTEPPPSAEELRERIAIAVCCGQYYGVGLGCILDGCEPDAGEQTACIAHKGYHDKTIDAVMAVLGTPPPAAAARGTDWRERLEDEKHRLENFFGWGAFRDGLTRQRIEQIDRELASPEVR